MIKLTGDESLDWMLIFNVCPNNSLVNLKIKYLNIYVGKPTTPQLKTMWGEMGTKPSERFERN